MLKRRPSKRLRPQINTLQAEALEQRVLLANTTIAFRDGVDGYQGTQDTRIRADQPGVDFGRSTKLELDGNPDMVTLLGWDVSQIPTGATVVAASITVEVINTSDDSFPLYEALLPWHERQANFNQRLTGVDWQSPGASGAADRGADPLGVLTAPDLGATTIELNADGLRTIERWIDDPGSNHGFVFQNLDNGSTNDLDFKSSEESNVSFRPQLVVEYAENATTSVAFRDGENGYAGTQDTRLRGDFPSRNFGGSSKLELDGNPDQVTLLQWDVSRIPADASVVGASITLEIVNASTDSFPIYEALTPWQEKQATFQDSLTGQAWASPGASGSADRGDTILGFVTGSALGPATIDLNADGLKVIEEWVEDPASNNGFVIQDLANGTTDDLDFRSSEDQTIAMRPQLSVDYLEGPAIPGAFGISLRNGIDGYVGTTDTRLRSDFPTRNFGGSTKLELDGRPDQVTLLRWDLSDVPEGATIQTGQVTINAINASNSTYYLYEGLTAWNEQQADFSQAADGSPWDEPGAAGSGDRGSQILGVLTAPDLGASTVALNSAGVAVLQKWLDDPASNHGFVIQNLNDRNTDDLDFKSSEESDISLRPELALTYDSDVPSAGRFSFEFVTYLVEEAEPSIQVRVNRLGGTAGTAAVSYETGDIDTTQGEDYVPVIGTLTFGDGQDSMLITVPIIQDSYVEGDEAFAVRLLDPTGGATLETDLTTVTIDDDDDDNPAGLFRFSQPMYMSGENAGSVTVTVVRDGGSSGAVTVDYNTDDDGALAGLDYTGVSGTLAFADGETEKTIVVPILDDDLAEQDERFWMYLTNPTGNANVVASGAQFIIKDDEPRSGSGDGLYAEYYDRADLMELAEVAVDSQVNFNWGNGSPGPDIGPSTFSVRWSGRIEPLYSETYTFVTTSDDGVRLWVDDQLIIDNWTTHASTEDAGTITLNASQLYDIRMEYFENTGGAVARLEWSSPSQAREVIPQSQLYSEKDRYNYGGHAYALTNTRMTWTEARDLAQQLGGNLVTVNDAAEETWLKQTFGEDQGFWLGINDVDAEGTFEWVSGEAVTYTNWAAGEPNNGGGSQDFGWMNYSPTKQWDDADAAAEYFGIIEFTTDAVPSQKAIFGSWGAPIDFPNIAVAAAALPNGKIVTWSSWDRFNFGGHNPQSYTSVFNTDTLQVEEFLITNTQHDMFCPGTVMLPDGRIMVNGGGSTVTSTSIYDFQTNSWSRVENMNMRRWYNASSTIADGRVLTWGGNAPDGHAGPAEVWEPEVGWTSIPNMDINIYAGTGDQTSWHPQMFQAPNGKVLIAGPGPEMYWADFRGPASTTVLESAGLRGGDAYSQHGGYVMYDVGKILKFGGADAEANSGTVTNRAWIIDVTGPNPVVTETGSMRFNRKFLNGVILPDGKVMAVGGNTSGNKFSDAGAVLQGEIWDPATGEWSVVDSMAIPRNYHSVALLQPDGRIFAGGGGLCGTCAANHSDAQVFSPAYLFDEAGDEVDRPVVSGPDEARYGTSLPVSVSASHTVERFNLIRLGTVTHSMNTDQRFIPANFTDLGNGQYSVDMPADGNIAPPGYYMLFAINDQGVPSESLVVQIDGVAVDTTQTSYDYDFGTSTSEVSPAWTRISNLTRGDISWDGPVMSVDRGLGPGVNNIKRDFVFSSEQRTLSHKIANGSWQITLNMGDKDVALDDMVVTAEGVTLSADIDSAVGEFAYVIGTVTVSDGELNITFSDGGGNDPNWVANRLSLIRSNPLQAGGLVVEEPTGEPVTALQVESLRDAVASYWSQRGADSSLFAGVQVIVSNLGGNLLGLQAGRTIYIDDDAAGFGWYIDQTPTAGELFVGMDLFTALAHEMGHVFGHDDLYDAADSSDLMYGYLESGERRAAMPTQALDAAYASIGLPDAIDEDLF